MSSRRPIGLLTWGRKAGRAAAEWFVPAHLKTSRPASSRSRGRLWRRSYRQRQVDRETRRQGDKERTSQAGNGSRTQENLISHLSVRGAQQHNLKNISVDLPRERMTVCCG